MNYSRLFQSILIAFGALVFAVVMDVFIHVVLGGIPVIVKILGLFAILVGMIYDSLYKGE